jgi:hypothetical protein
MFNPAQQLHVRLCYWNTFFLHDSSQFILGTNILSSLEFVGQENLWVLPSICSLRKLTIKNCSQLLTIGNYQNLTCLRFLSCAGLWKIGNTKNLSILNVMTDKRNDYQFFPMLSLENLTELLFSGHVGSIITNLHRLTNLTTFGCILLGEDRSLSILPMPSLQRLIVKDLEEVNLSGLSKLNHLEASYIKKIQGQEDV